MIIEVMTVVDVDRDGGQPVVLTVTRTDKESLRKSRSIADVSTLPNAQRKLYLSYDVAVEMAKRDGFEVLMERVSAKVKIAFLMRETPEP